jgi:hypothetical protein
MINYELPSGVHGFLTPDAWVRHPDPLKSRYVRAVGRLDDVVRLHTTIIAHPSLTFSQTVLSNGEKTDNKQLGTRTRVPSNMDLFAHDRTGCCRKPYDGLATRIASCCVWQWEVP